MTKAHVGSGTPWICLHIEPQSQCGHTWGNHHMWSHVWPHLWMVPHMWTHICPHVWTYVFSLVWAHLCLNSHRCVLMCGQILRCGHICGGKSTGMATPVKIRKNCQEYFLFCFNAKFVSFFAKQCAPFGSALRLSHWNSVRPPKVFDHPKSSFNPL